MLFYVSSCYRLFYYVLSVKEVSRNHKESCESLKNDFLFSILWYSKNIF